MATKPTKKPSTCLTCPYVGSKQAEGMNYVVSVCRKDPPPWSVVDPRRDWCGAHPLRVLKPMLVDLDVDWQEVVERKLKEMEQ
jgi:hypothetical protein